jgi:hypothetical protein
MTFVKEVYAFGNESSETVLDKGLLLSLFNINQLCIVSGIFSIILADFKDVPLLAILEYSRHGLLGCDAM